MAGNLTITAANSSIWITIPRVYDRPVKLEGYTADAMFETEAVEPVELVKGVDGNLSGGFVPFLTAQTYHIMPDSPASIVFETWLAEMKRIREVLWADAEISIPSIQRKYVCTKGALSSIVALPNARKVLDGRPFRITWDDVDPATL